MRLTLDHVQIALPAGGEDAARAFYLAGLGLHEIPKPPALIDRGGFWASGAGTPLHFGIDPEFRPARKAHIALRIPDLDALAERLGASGYDVLWDTTLPDIRRFFSADPAGNRIELIQA